MTINYNWSKTKLMTDDIYHDCHLVQQCIIFSTFAKQLNLRISASGCCNTVNKVMWLTYWSSAQEWCSHSPSSHQCHSTETRKWISSPWLYQWTACVLSETQIDQTFHLMTRRPRELITLTWYHCSSLTSFFSSLHMNSLLLCNQVLHYLQGHNSGGHFYLDNNIHLCFQFFSMLWYPFQPDHRNKCNNRQLC